MRWKQLTPLREPAFVSERRQVSLPSKPAPQLEAAPPPSTGGQHPWMQQAVCAQSAAPEQGRRKRWGPVRSCLLLHAAASQGAGCLQCAGGMSCLQCAGSMSCLQARCTSSSAGWLPLATREQAGQVHWGRQATAGDVAAAWGHTALSYDKAKRPMPCTHIAATTKRGGKSIQTRH